MTQHHCKSITTRRCGMAPIAALVLGALLLPASAGAASETAECDSRSCFAQHFQQCEAASHAEQQGIAAVRYAIEGPADDGCKVSMVFTDNPNPEWVDQPLTFVLDTDEPLDGQLQDAVEACMTGDAAGYQCGGALHALLHGESGADGGGEPLSAVGADERPCGKPVAVTGEPLYPLPRNGRWGYVDGDGEWVIEPQWRQAGFFSEGRAAVDAGTASGSVWGVIDRDGDYVVEPELASMGGYVLGEAEAIFAEPLIQPFSEGCAAVDMEQPWFLTRDGKTWLRDGLPDGLAELDTGDVDSFVTPDGEDWADQLADIPETLADARVISFDGFHEGLTRFQVRPEGWPIEKDVFGWMNTAGEVVVRPLFQGGGHFGNGVAPAGIRDGLWGYIDTEGNPADWPDRWTLPVAGSVSDGIAWFGDDTIFYLDAEDYSAINDPTITLDEPLTVQVFAGDEAQLQEARIIDGGDFSDGLALVELESTDKDAAKTLAYIDTEGEVAFALNDYNVCQPSPGYALETGFDAMRFRNGLARLRVAEKAPGCNTMRNDGAFLVSDRSHFIYIDTDGEIVFEESRTADEAS